eukprot:552645-Rhodomonas_salina.1
MECLRRLPIVTSEIDEVLLQFLSDSVAMSKSSAGFAVEKVVAIRVVQRFAETELPRIRTFEIAEE